MRVFCPGLLGVDAKVGTGYSVELIRKDRKSTRLNSSHLGTSYAVFCLKIKMRDFGTPAQRDEFIPGLLDESKRMTFGLTEPEHGSDATQLETRAARESGDGCPGWRIDWQKMWPTGMHPATHCLLFARTSGDAGDARGISAFVVPARADGVTIEEYLWTFNMPTYPPFPNMTLFR